MVFKLYPNKAVKNEMTFTILGSVYMERGPALIQTVSMFPRPFHRPLLWISRVYEQPPPLPPVTGAEILSPF